MFKNFSFFFHKKEKEIKEEIFLKSKIDGTLNKLVREEILKNSDLEYDLLYSINKGVIKIKTNNKVLAQEIALKISSLEKKLKDDGIVFNKLLI